MRQQLSKERLTKLVSAAKADKEEKFEQLYTEYLPLVYYRSFVMLHDRGEAQKVAQACFAHVYEHIEELREPEYFQTWIRAVTVSACQGMLQARKYTRDVNAGLDRDILADLLGGGEAWTPDEALAAHEDDERIWASIQALSQKQKEVILLYYLEGLSVDEIAEVLNISYSAAHSRLFKARRLLLTLLEDNEAAVAVVFASGD